jgi:hypothetical protein
VVGVVSQEQQHTDNDDNDDDFSAVANLLFQHYAFRENIFTTLYTTTFKIDLSNSILSDFVLSQLYPSLQTITGTSKRKRARLKANL